MWLVLGSVEIYDKHNEQLVDPLLIKRIDVKKVIQFKQFKNDQKKFK